MPASALYQELYDALAQKKMMDPHTHLTPGRLAARGLHDILLYHMVISDLYSAGCPDGARLPEDPTDEEAHRRLSRAVPFVRHIQNTSCFWGVRIILKDLYGWDAPITESNWKELDGVIRKKAADPRWKDEIIRRCNIERFCTELARRGDGSFDSQCDYSLEWAFFTRSQWGCFDSALLELEYAWNMPEPGPPLPVTVDRSKLDFKKTIRTVDDAREAMRHYCDKIPYRMLTNIASHFSTDVSYRDVDEAEMAAALKDRAHAGPAERDVYANFVFGLFLREFRKKESGLVLQFSLGAEPLPYETGSKMRTETVFELARIFHQNPDISFNLHIASEHQSQAFCTLARELPNVSFTGYWWHNFFPEAIRHVMRQRFDMVAANKQVGFISDAYCLDWTYAKTVLVRKQMAQVLEEKVLQGQYTPESALAFAGRILYDTPKEIFSIR